MQLKAKLFISGVIDVKTGLYIGGSKAQVEIGGLDNSVIKDVNGVPYIPGSSLKGKMRSLLELSLGNYQGKIRYSDNNSDKRSQEFSNSNEYNEKYNEISQNYKIEKIEANPCSCGNCDVCAIFGVSASENSLIGRTRLYVRDAKLDEEQFKNMFKNLDMEYTEIKTENTIDRLSAASKSGFRTVERVPAGAQFDLNLVYNIYDVDVDIDRFAQVIHALRLVQDDYLGGSGSRGYGQVEFINMVVKIKTIQQYEENAEADIVGVQATDLKNLEEDKLKSAITKLFGCGKNEEC